MEQLRLFVYGTLRRGRSNHGYIEGRYTRMLPARLQGFVRIDPMMVVPRDGGAVDGELYFLIAATYEETLAACDELEEIPPGKTVGPFYRRNKVHVETAEGTITAWAYVHPSAAEG